VSRAFSSWNRSILTEIHLCHACSDHENEDRTAVHGDVPMRGVGIGWTPRKLQLDAVEVVAGGRRLALGPGREPRSEEREPEPAPQPISPPQSVPAVPAQQQVEAAALDHRDTSWVDTIIEQQLADLESLPTGHYRQGQRRARHVDSSWQSLCAQRFQLGIGPHWLRFTYGTPVLITRWRMETDARSALSASVRACPS
jgi:hypothetical protein